MLLTADKYAGRNRRRDRKKTIYYLSGKFGDYSKEPYIKLHT